MHSEKLDSELMILDWTTAIPQLPRKLSESNYSARSTQSKKGSDACHATHPEMHAIILPKDFTRASSTETSNSGVGRCHEAIGCTAVRLKRTGVNEFRMVLL